MSYQLFELVFIDRKVASKSVHVKLNKIIVRQTLRQIKARPLLVFNLHKALYHAVEHVEFLSLKTGKFCLKFPVPLCNLLRFEYCGVGLSKIAVFKLALALIEKELEGV